MTKEQLFDLLGEADEREVQNAGAPPTRHWWQWAVAAACLVLIAGATWLFRAPSEVPDASGDGPPGLTFNGTHYTVSSYVAISETCPEGFVYGGEADGAACYVNPDIPEWVYVYTEVRTDGTVDAHGTLTSTEPHMAYLRYVDSRIRGDRYVCYNGTLYQSMWSIQSYGEYADLTPEAYDAIVAQYGLRMEGDAPEGFVSAGTAAFSGYDTVPEGALSCNTGTPEVLVSPEDRGVILVSTTWHTAPADDGERTHTGWDVYVRCQ